MRILLVDNLMIRRYGNLRMGPGRKLMCGAIRGNHRLCEFSDRDLARLLAPCGIRRIGGWVTNKRLIQTAKNFRPDILLLGHCDYIRNWALQEIRCLLPGIRMAHFNVDPIWDEWHIKQINERLDVTDAIFVTTAGNALKKFCTGKNVVAYMPNPSDPSMEVSDNGQKQQFTRDLFFAGNEQKGDPRVPFIKELKSRLKGRIDFETFGMFGSPGVWGAVYEDVLATSKMSLNLNRREGDKYYSSDRIAHLMGSGILTFISSQNSFQDFFSSEEAVYFDALDDLVEKICYYQSHDAERAAIASAGREKYHRLFNGERVLRFMIETMTEQPYSEAYEWSGEVYR